MEGCGLLAVSRTAISSGGSDKNKAVDTRQNSGFFSPIFLMTCPNTEGNQGTCGEFAEIFPLLMEICAFLFSHVPLCTHKYTKIKD